MHATLGRAANAFFNAPLEAYASAVGRQDAEAPLAPSGRAVTEALREMSRTPKALDRPVVVLGGYRSWPFLASRLRDRLIALTSGEATDIVAISYTLRSRFDDAASIAMDRLRSWRTDVADATTEVDIVGISMGGLVARALLAGNDGPRSARVFTLATPHRGARLAERIAPDDAARAMVPDSPTLQRLDHAWMSRSYELIPYAVLDDHWVGASRTAPAGVDPLWTSGPPLISHLSMSALPGVIADIARRLRGEQPLAKAPSPPPRE